MSKRDKKICIIILNWRSKEETVECIKSLNEHISNPYAIMIIDNDSNDGSVEYIESNISSVYKSIDIYRKTEWINISPISLGNILIYETEKNGGYAYGNNIGMAMAFSMGFEYVWILNNDTYVTNDALTPMIEESIKIKNSGCDGVVGSIIKKSNGEVECYGGGTVYPCLGKVRVVRQYNKKKLEDRNFFLMGSSMLIPLQVYKSIGGIDEDYFMYFEEADWQRKMLSAGHSVSIAEDSIVYHRSAEKNKSTNYYYYMSRSGVIFSRRYCPVGGYISLLYILASIVIKTAFDYRAIKATLSGVIDGFFHKNKLPE